MTKRLERGTRWALVGATMLLAACGTARGPQLAPPVSVDGVDALAVGSGVAIAFNDAYRERIDLNEPRARKNPKNTDKALLRLIKTSRTSISGAFYDIEDLGVTEALVAACRRGVKVRLVTDTDNMVEKHDPAKPREAIQLLGASGVRVVDDRRSGIMHHKFMVVDGQTLWTGSTNLTPTSLYRHNNNALTIRNRRLAHAFEDEFERLFERREFGKSSRGETQPTDEIPLGSGMTVQAFFSPGGNGRAAVVREVRDAKRSIRFMTFSLTDVETGDALVERAKAGVKVEGVFDRWLAAGQYSLFDRFKAAKLEVRKDGNEALMHHKVIVVDNDTVITGSYNYSQNAEHNNNEAFLIFRHARSVAGAFADEYERLRQAAIVNRPPPHKADDAEKKTGEGP
ncbi:MAG: phospholipase D-like domain-containing protein [Candidatus Sericytochromatia bacterium]|nr:phospholipase D-like domain-containing protein [Candidatus Sericytochromatia bacterium]